MGPDGLSVDLLHFHFNEWRVNVPFLFFLPLFNQQEGFISC